MRRWIVGAVIALSSVTATAQPDKDWWACQYTEGTGMSWEYDRWEVRSFKLERPFVLVSDGSGLLTVESVAKAFDGEPSWYQCDDRSPGRVWCRDYVGSSLFFDPSTGNGGTSYLLSTITDSRSEDMDDVGVFAFECTKG